MLTFCGHWNNGMKTFLSQMFVGAYSDTFHPYKKLYIFSSKESFIIYVCFVYLKCIFQSA